MSTLSQAEINIICTCGVVLLLGIIGALLGSLKGRAAFGFVLGLLIGPIGWLIILVLPKQKPPGEDPFAEQ